MTKKFKIIAFITLGLGLVSLITFIYWFKNSAPAEYSAMISAYWYVYKPLIFIFVIVLLFSTALIFTFIPKLMSRGSDLFVNLQSQELKVVLQLLDNDPQAAITKSFTILEDKLRKMTGDIESKTNIRAVTTAAFGEQGLYTYKGDPKEDGYIKALLDSAFSLFRNPNAHQLKDIDHENAISVIVVVDMLLNIVTKAVHKK